MPRAAFTHFRRELSALLRGGEHETAAHLHLRTRLTVIATASTVVAASGTVLAFLFERRAPGSDITNIGDALFWTMVQLLTVSSNMVNPLTTPGRILDVFLEAYAITVVTTLAGSFGAFFHRRGVEGDPIVHGQPGVSG
jgi:ion channel